jgi:hypothetical protein
LNTRQVMHPAVYLAGERTPPFHLPPLETIWGSNYEMLDSGTLGEFDILMFAEQFGSEEKAPQIAAQWRGGYYSAAQLKTEGAGPESKAPGTEHPSAPVMPATAQETAGHSGVVALFYLSRWATPAAAAQFAHLYASSVEQRYSGATPRSKPAIAGQSAETTSAWSTPEGSVSVETRGPLVLVLESFDDSTASKLRGMVIGRELSKGPPPSGPR